MVSLEIDHVTKRFGTTVALDGLAFEVARGEVFGFLGANGAGKTTTMRICLGILRADAGEIRWDGRPTEDLPRRTWGYLPEERGLYPRMGVLDQLVYFASLYGEAPDVARREALGWLTRFRIPEYADRRAEELSKGNQQKVQFIAAVLHDPEVLLMDEPFTGLDPVNLVLLREAFMELRDRGRTLIFSTHQMEAAEAMCESVAIVDHGRLVAGGRVRDLKRASGRRTLRLAVDGELAPTWLAELPGVVGLRPDRGGFAAGAPARRGLGGHPRRGPRARGRRCTGSRWSSRASRRCSSSTSVVRPTRTPTLAPDVATASLSTERRDLMARSDPLLPNAGIVARREYRDRTRSPLFLASTVVLAILAMLVAVAPIAIRYLDRQTVTRIAVVSSDPELAQRAVAVADSLLNVPPGGVAGSGVGAAVRRSKSSTRRIGRSRCCGRRDRRLPRRRAAAERPGRRRAADVRRAGQRPQPGPERRVVRHRRPRLERQAAAGPDGSVRRPDLPGRVDERRRPTAAGHSTRRRPRAAASSGSSSSSCCSSPS